MAGSDGDKPTEAGKASEPLAMEEDTVADEDQDPKAIPDMSEAQNIFLVELAATHPQVVPDLEAVKAQLLAKVSERVV